MEEVDPNLLQKEAATIAEAQHTTEGATNGKGKQAIQPVVLPKAIPLPEEGFASPVFSTSAQPVTNFGVVGRGTKRAPTSPPASSSTSSSAPPGTSSSSSSFSSTSTTSTPSSGGEKRKLADLMVGEEGFGEKRTKSEI